MLYRHSSIQLQKKKKPAVSHRLKSLLALHEGLRLKPYRDTTGHLTIGYGLNLDAGITEGEAEYLLESRIEETIRQLQKKLFWFDELDEVRKMVLVDMAYNLGVAGLLKWTNTLRYAKEGQYNSASLAMSRSLWARQVKTRANRLIQMMKTGEYPKELEL